MKKSKLKVMYQSFIVLKENVEKPRNTAFEG
jgi:hypothetical protein